MKVGETSLNYVTDIGDTAPPSGAGRHLHEGQHEKDRARRPDTKSFEVTFLYDNSAADSDYRVLKALQEAGEPVELEVKFPPAVFAASGYVSVMVSSAKVDELVSAKLTF